MITNARETRKAIGAIYLAAMGLWCLVAVQCSQAPPAAVQPEGSGAPAMTYKGYTIQLFATPEEQLRHAKGWFADFAEKRAVLEALIARNPDLPTIRAEAELELAYLALGPDYRFAGAEACRQAIAQYQAILSRFSDQPSVSAKAHWYLGWIHADLLGRTVEALMHYRIIAEQYGDVVLRIEPPVPWVSLVLPQIEDKSPAVYERPIYYWRSLALLEIVRLADNEGEKWQAFEWLWSEYRDSPAALTALRLLLDGPRGLALRAAAHSRGFEISSSANRPVADDIAKLMDRLRPEGVDSPRATGDTR